MDIIQLREEKDALFNKLYFYLSEFEKLKEQFSEAVCLRQYKKDHAEVNEKVLSLIKYKGRLVPYVQEMINILKTYYENLSDKKRVSLLYKLFTDFDTALSDPSNNFGMGLELLLNGNLFINTSNYWRSEYKHKPAHSFEYLFRSFGICTLPGKSQVIDMSDTIHQLSAGKNPFLKELKNTVNIGLFPLSEKYNIKFRFTDITDATKNEWGFQADKLDFPDYKEELNKVVQCIKDNKIHIACFPELLICDQSIAYIKSKLAELDLPFFLLIGGSFHRKDHAGNIKNIMPITLYLRGKQQEYTYAKLQKYWTRANKIKDIEEDFHAALLKLFSNSHDMTWSQNKFVNEATLIEDISMDNSLLVLSFREIGSIGFLICKDMLQNPNGKILTYIRLVDHLFVSSMNFSEAGNFSTKAEELKNQHKISCFYVNAKSFDPENISPTFYQTPKPADYQSITPDKPWLIYPLEIKRTRTSQI